MKKKNNLSYLLFLLTFTVSLFLCQAQSVHASRLPVLYPEQPAGKIGNTKTGTRVEIPDGMCNPAKSYPHPRSCEAMRINAEDFRVRIKHRPIVGTNIGHSEFTLGVNEERSTTFFTTYYTRVEGYNLCVYAYLFGGIAGKYGVIFHDSQYVGKNAGKTYLFDPSGPSSRGLKNIYNPPGAKTRYNCIRLPMPDETIRDLSWAGVVSPVCFGTAPDTLNSVVETQFDINDTFSTSNELLEEIASDPQLAADINGVPNPPETWMRSILGKVSVCVENTISNIFTEPNNGGLSHFEVVKRNLRNVVFALLVLYVVLQGYGIIASVNERLSMQKAMWMGLKPALVIFFAIGPGITSLVEPIHNATKSLSLIVLEASSGNTNFNASLADYNVAKDEYEIAQDGYDSVKRENPTNIYAPNDDQQVILPPAVVTAQEELDEARDNYLAASDALKSNGYNHCNFSQFSADYNADSEYMALWDTLDCKIQKYLGVGANPYFKKASQLFLISATIAFIPLIGLPCFILAVVFFFYMFMVILRIISIYLISIIAVTLLLFIAPIIVPMALFSYTKSVFTGWYTQILAYMIQPVIMFAFLGFLFAGYDAAMFGDNYFFVQPTSSADLENFYTNKMCFSVKGSNLLSRDSVCSIDEFRESSLSNLTCDDPTAINCIIERSGHKKITIPIINADLFVATFDSIKGVYYFMLGIIMLLFVSFIANLVLIHIEKMSKTLTNATGGGAAGISGVPRYSVTQIGSAVNRGANKIKSGVKGLSGGSSSRKVRRK